MIRSAVRFPIPGTDWKNPTSPAPIAPSRALTGPAPSTASASLGPTACTPSKQQEQISLGLRPKSHEHQRVVAHDEVRAQSGFAPEGSDTGQRLRGDRQAVANPAAHERHVLEAALGDLSAKQRDHPVAAVSAAERGAWLAWQIATARASAAWSGWGSDGRARSAATMRATCSFDARPLPHTAPLTCWGV